MRGSRILRITVLITAIVAATEWATAAEPEPSAWILEHFGDEVSILRSQPLAQDLFGQDDASAARIFLSCAGRHRRLRIALPHRGRRSTGIARDGYLMVRSSGFAERPSIVARFAAPDPHVLVVWDEGGASQRNPISDLGRILATQPTALDVLVRPSDATSFRQIERFVLPLRFGRGDVEAIQRFMATCRHSGTIKRLGGPQ